jgi:peptide/nickel transport system substrate-binding protein
MKIGKRQAAALLAAAALPAPAMAQSAREIRQRTLVVGVPSEPANLEPGTNRAEPIGSEIILNVFDTLVAWKAPAFDTLEGRLAASWTVSADGKVFDFALRPNVKFHDGTACDAAAVKAALERTKAINPYMRASFDPIAGIEATGPLALRITLKETMPVFLSLLAQPQAAIASPTAWQRHGDAFSVNPVGTGPFRFRSYRRDTDVVLDANPDYFRGAPQLARIIYRIIPDASTRRLELENGGLDIVHQAGQLAAPPVQDVRALRSNPDIEVIEVPSQIIRQLEFNNNRPDSPVADVRVRRAIQHAIDYDGLLSGIFGGTADRVYGPLTSNSWAFDARMRELAPRHDPAAARRLLAEAGIQPGQLKLTMYSFQGALWGAVATFLQANLAAVGIEATIAQTEFPAYRALHVAGRHEIALDGRQPWYNDPDAHITIGYLSSLADSAMTFRMPKDEALDSLILRAQTEVDFDRRKALYHRVQAEIVARAPAAWLFSPKLIVFRRKGVQGLVVNSAPPLNEYWGVSKG